MAVRAFFGGTKLVRMDWRTPLGCTTFAPSPLPMLDALPHDVLRLIVARTRLAPFACLCRGVPPALLRDVAARKLQRAFGRLRPYLAPFYEGERVRVWLRPSHLPGEAWRGAGAGGTGRLIAADGVLTTLAGIASVQASRGPRLHHIVFVDGRHRLRRRLVTVPSPSSRSVLRRRT